MTSVFCAIVVGLLTLQTVHWPAQTRLWRELQNAGHIPLFGAFALTSFWFSVEVLGERIRHRYLHYLIALTITFVASSGTEFLQLFVPRDADPFDVVRSMAGAVCFLLLYSTWDPRLAHEWKRYRMGAKGIALGVVVIVLVLSLVPLISWSIAYAQRDFAFPQLVSFGSYWSARFVQTQDAQLRLMKPPQAWHMAHSGFVGKLQLTVAGYPGFWINDPYPDWTGYDSLAFEVYSELSSTVTLTLRIHDRRHDYRYSDRFNRKLEISPGLNRFQIPLEAIRHGPQNRLLDMKRIAAVALFAVHPSKPYALYVSNFRLQARSAGLDRRSRLENIDG